MLVAIALVGIILVLTLLYFKGRNNQEYWRKKGVIFHPENKALGPVWKYAKSNRPFFEIYGDIYKLYPTEPVVGIGGFKEPAIFIRDPANIRHVLQNDFQSFYHRGVVMLESDKLADSIVFTNGVRWKLMRQSMTPLFTAAKLKNMYYIIDKGAADFVDYLQKNPDKCQGDMYNTLTTFCSAAVVAAVFGLGTESIFDSPFLKVAREAVKPTALNTARFTVGQINPKINKALNLTVFGKYEDFFIGAVKKLLRQRETEKTPRHDFAELCLKIQRNGTMKDQETGYELEPTDEMLAAQGFFFLIAGVEPCATALFATLIELGRNPHVLKQILKEIDDGFESSGGKINYDVINNMEYLDQVLNESMRKHAPVGFVTRKCMKDSVLPVGNVKIEAGTRVTLPIYEIHHDPRYFPEPELFDPGRFASSAAHEAFFMPFGAGPRLCVGARYARLQVKAGLVYVLRHFTPKTNEISGNDKFVKQPVQVRLNNVDVQLVPRNR